MRRLKLLLISGLGVLALAACGTTTPTDTETSIPDTSSIMESVNPDMGSDSEEGRVFTEEELSEFDGKDGNPAYVAVDGVVYDVTDSEAWANGEHQNDITAGRVLSDEILESPHGKGVLDNLPVVGTMAEE